MRQGRVVNLGRGDYRGFVRTPAEPATCEAACQNEVARQGCRAWAFVPANDNRAAACFLKNGSYAANIATNKGLPLTRTARWCR